LILPTYWGDENADADSFCGPQPMFRWHWRRLAQWRQPEAWLAEVLRRSADHPAPRIDQLLRWQWKRADQAIAA
jgi:hypothetical protein